MNKQTCIEKFYYFVNVDRKKLCMTETEVEQLIELNPDGSVAIPNNFIGKLPGNFTTVCIKEINGVVGRGISPCSPNDEFNLNDGKFWARRKAEQAIKGRGVDSIVRSAAINTLLRTGCPFSESGKVNPVLSFFEKQLLYGKKRVYNDAKEKMNNTNSRVIDSIPPPTLCGLDSWHFKKGHVKWDYNDDLTRKYIENITKDTIINMISYGSPIIDTIRRNI